VVFLAYLGQGYLTYLQGSWFIQVILAVAVHRVVGNVVSFAPEDIGDLFISYALWMIHGKSHSVYD
jgi:hypothetical protein